MSSILLLKGTPEDIKYLVKVYLIKVGGEKTTGKYLQGAGLDITVLVLQLSQDCQT